MGSRVDALLLTPLTQVVQRVSAKHFEDIFEGNRHRVFSLAFYMTDSEPEAEEVMTQTFCRAFRAYERPSAEQIDRALVSELREIKPIGQLSLPEKPAADVEAVRGNTKRADLERAVVQLPATERMIFLMHDVESYDHARIARTLGITQEESKSGLFRARLRMRELIAALKKQSA